jgi:hypothetical protein
VIKTDAEWLQALRSGDRDRMRELLADDFTGITLLGKRLNKEGWVALFTSDWSREYRKSVTSDQTIRQYGDIQILTGDVRYPRSAAVYTRIWHKSNGKWRLAASQETAVILAAPK